MSDRLAQTVARLRDEGAVTQTPPLPTKSAKPQRGKPEQCQLCDAWPAREEAARRARAQAAIAIHHPLMAARGLEWRKPKTLFIVAHHWRGYDYPDDVWWVCYACNYVLQGCHNGAFTLEEARRDLLGCIARHSTLTGWALERRLTKLRAVRQKRTKEVT